MFTNINKVFTLLSTGSILASPILMNNNISIMNKSSNNNLNDYTNYSKNYQTQWNNMHTETASILNNFVKDSAWYKMGKGEWTSGYKDYFQSMYINVVKGDVNTHPLLTQLKPAFALHMDLSLQSLTGLGVEDTENINKSDPTKNHNEVAFQAIFKVSGYWITKDFDSDYEIGVGQNELFFNELPIKFNVVYTPNGISIRTEMPTIYLFKDHSKNRGWNNTLTGAYPNSNEVTYHEADSAEIKKDWNLIGWKNLNMDAISQKELVSFVDKLNNPDKNLYSNFAWTQSNVDENTQVIKSTKKRILNPAAVEPGIFKNKSINADSWSDNFFFSIGYNTENGDFKLQSKQDLRDIDITAPITGLDSQSTSPKGRFLDMIANESLKYDAASHTISSTNFSGTETIIDKSSISDTKTFWESLLEKGESKVEDWMFDIIKKAIFGLFGL